MISSSLTDELVIQVRTGAGCATARAQAANSAQKSINLKCGVPPTHGNNLTGHPQDAIARKTKGDSVFYILYEQSRDCFNGRLKTVQFQHYSFGF
jgi:hypothetical protein